MTLPRLRPVEALPAPTGEVRLRDPLGLAGEGTARPFGELRLGADTWRVARRLDGSTDAEALAEALGAEAGSPFPVQRVEAAVDELSACGLLEDDVYGKRRTQAAAAFDALPERPAVGPGRDYHPDPMALRIRVAGLVADDWDMPPPEGLVGLLSPSASFERAPELYARTYAALRIAGKGLDRIVCLGTSPAPTSSLLVPLRRPFATPLGTIPVDEEGHDALGLTAPGDELAHRDALVLERQLLFLRLLLPGLPVLPLLVGALPPDPAAVENDPRVDVALEALERVCALGPRTLVLVASDLARLLSAQADRLVLPTRTRTHLRERDRRIMDRALDGDAADWWRLAAETGDPARAARALPTYLLLRLMADRDVRADVLGYVQMPAREEFGTAATVAFRDRALAPG